MIRTVQIRDLTIGEGKPNVIVPIVGRTRSEILGNALSMDLAQIDLIEWRVDFYEDVFDSVKLLNTLAQLRDTLKEMPILFTFRTKSEGGEKEIRINEYVNLNNEIAKTGLVDLIDVEIMLGDETVEKLIKSFHGYGVKVIASNHDFQKTPSEEEIIFRLKKMQVMNADILKIAVMPNNREDVLKLMRATNRMQTEYADRPVVAMSMGGLGVITRLSGEVFGSAMTFGAVGQVSAPGQIPVEELDVVLNIVHNAL
ncbi:type I 3-dehydroquinate dehydratase [Acidaminobacter hydrogenoformans]|uniref:3-dehydroquinate dehydratase n=1 Tax=Acidaminobacter hydrogenoformans DSM 2784 TaxID=1120920 RepID=A0A1G5RZM9_9FIRM|nr:type I 3-dehydroquinate dehydratase [Acidaminobacter hydrogenoformans]SCZ79318.1 3-dehydroquinate dehydratase [Acidaminobacter hydrogenoformans DSM 2784]